MLLKLLLMGGVLVAVYVVFFKKKGIGGTSASQPPSDEAMVPCEQCGTYVQVKEALIKEGRYYCSRECMEN